VARLLHTLVEPPHACPYLADREAQLEIRVQIDVAPAELDAMLSRGWRRFGPVYFRPACASCNECVTLRVVTAEFAPTKSQRRAARNARQLTRTVGTPKIDEERLALYRKWHAQREEARGWEESPIDAQRYGFDFAFPHPSVREVAFRDATDNRLVGLGICDETPNAISAVYFFWDPDFAPASLGVGHVVTLIEDARDRGLPYVYLGYRVLDCASLVYKARYGPHELLEARPSDTEPPRWRR
jgi:arginyl-tRNA--protein-N-Asp/Glu arginylyltransferase